MGRGVTEGRGGNGAASSRPVTRLSHARFVTRGRLPGAAGSRALMILFRLTAQAAGLAYHCREWRCLPSVGGGWN